MKKIVLSFVLICFCFAPFGLTEAAKIEIKVKKIWGGLAHIKMIYITTESGDTLKKIAKQVNKECELPPDYITSEMIYNHNRKIIGPDPNQLKIGLTLKITYPDLD